MSREARPQGAVLRRLEAIVVVLVAVHSYAVGAMLLVIPSLATRLGGWPAVQPLFFPRQGGVFHLVVATGYLLEYRRHRGVTLLVTAKTAAAVFLLTHALIAPETWLVPVLGAGDALMGALVLLLHRRLRSAAPSP